jgi:hypothetical protein
MTRGSILTASTLAAFAALTLPSLAYAANPTTAECVAAADSSLQLREQHKLRAARAQMLVCASASCPAAVQSECLRRVDQANAAIPTIVFEAKDGAGNDLSNVKVDMDGQPLTDRLDGSSVQVDPGEHHFHFTAPGGVVMDKTMVLREGEKERRERIVLGATPAAPLATPVQPAPAGATAPVSETASEDPGASRKTLAYVVGGVGVAGLVVGTVFGLMASSSASSSKNECSASSCTNYSQSLSDYNTASTDGTISTVAFIAGGAAVAAGAILFFTAPTSASSGSTGSWWQLSPSVGGTGLGLSVRGAL